jgi:hypothetical protein
VLRTTKTYESTEERLSCELTRVDVLATRNVRREEADRARSCDRKRCVCVVCVCVCVPCVRGVLCGCFVWGVVKRRHRERASKQASEQEK